MRFFTAIVVGLVLTFIVVIIALLISALAHSESPTVIMQPGKAPTYVYPGSNGLPTVIIPPQPAPLTYVYPGTPLPSTPMTTLPTYIPGPMLPMPGGYGR